MLIPVTSPLRFFGGNPTFSNVKALLHFNGTDASTTFTDVTGKTWTAAGSAQIDTANSYFGSASGLFDGADDYISTPYSADFTVGTSDFTFECFFYVDSGQTYPNTTVTLMCVGHQDTSDGGWNVGYSNTQVYVQAVNGATISVSAITLGSALSKSTWHYYAVSRISGVCYFHLDGVYLGSDSNLSGITLGNPASASTLIGCGVNASSSYNWEHKGHIDELRFVNGQGLYSNKDYGTPLSQFGEY